MKSFAQIKLQPDDILEWPLRFVDFISQVTSCVRLWEEPQTAFPMSSAWASHIAASVLMRQTTQSIIQLISILVTVMLQMLAPWNAITRALRGREYDCDHRTDWVNYEYIDLLGDKFVETFTTFRPLD